MGRDQDMGRRGGRETRERLLVNDVFNHIAVDVGKAQRIKDSPVNGTSAPVFRLMSDS